MPSVGGETELRRVTLRLRDARALVEQLEEARALLAERRRNEQREDAIEQATGTSSLDRALETARGIVRRLESMLGAAGGDTRSDRDDSRASA